MLEHIRGDVVDVSEGAAVVSVGGVGVRIQMPTHDLAGLSGEVTIFTVLQIKDEEVHLYGFSSERSRSLFRELLSVSKVGPKAAMSILSYHKPEALERAIAGGDAGAIGLANGVGKKTADRIVLELKDKFGGVAEVAAAPEHSALAEVREALKQMGFSPTEVQEVLAGLPPDGDAPTLLRHALKTLGSSDVAVVES